MAVALETFLVESALTSGSSPGTATSTRAMTPTPAAVIRPAPTAAGRSAGPTTNESRREAATNSRAAHRMTTSGPTQNRRNTTMAQASPAPTRSAA